MGWNGMPAPDGGVRATHEQANPVTTPEVEQVSGAVTNIELQDQAQIYGHAITQEVGTNDVVPNQYDADTITPEMPASHANVDPETISATGLIKACKYFADLAAKDPTLAGSMAERATQSKKQEAVMQQSGMERDEIKKQQWASRSERHKEKVKAEEKSELKSEPEKAKQPEPLEEAAAGPAESVRQTAPPEVPVQALRPEIPGLAVIDQITRQPEERLHETPVPEDKPPILMEDLPPETAPLLPPELFQHVSQEQAGISGSTEAELPPPAAPLHERRAFEPAQPDERIRKVRAVRAERQTVEYTAPAEVTIERPVDAVSPEEPAPPIEPREVVEPPEISSPEEVIAESSIESVEATGMAPIDVVALPMTEVIDEPPDSQADEAPDTATLPAGTPHGVIGTAVRNRSEVISWAEEAAKEPEELYEAFTEALQNLVATPELPVVAANESVATDTIEMDGTAPDEQPAPAITAAVAERLVRLEPEERTVVAPILKEVVGALHEIGLLHTSEAEADVIEAAEERLRELIVTLFESIGLEYEEEDVAVFARTLQRPDFQPPRTVEAIAADLEHDGTHEAKYHFPQITVILSDAENRLQQVLGTMALFYARTTSALSV